MASAVTHTFTTFILASILFSTVAMAQTSSPLTGGYPFGLRKVASPVANCIRNMAATGYPLYCDASNSDRTDFTITGPAIVPGDFLTSPTTPASLNPYGSGSTSAWCFPKNSTSYPSTYNNVLCNGAPTWGWIQLIKTAGVYGNGLYSGDEVAIANNMTGKFCSGSVINCNVLDIAMADRFTLIFA